MTTLDTSYHKRWRDERMQDPEFRQEYEAARQQIDQVDAVVRALDQLRIEAGLPKAELARRIGKNPAAVRRLFSAEGNPELRTIAAIAVALNAEIQIVPRTTAVQQPARRRTPRAAPGVAHGQTQAGDRGRQMGDRDLVLCCHHRSPGG